MASDQGPSQERLAPVLVSPASRACYGLLGSMLTTYVYGLRPVRQVPRGATLGPARRRHRESLLAIDELMRDKPSAIPMAARQCAALFTECSLGT
jgi:hypothetical protein